MSDVCRSVFCGTVRVFRRWTDDRGRRGGTRGREEAATGMEYEEKEQEIEGG